MIVGCLAAKKGFGLDIYEIRTNDLVTALEIFYFGDLSYITLLGLCKSSVLFFTFVSFPTDDLASLVTLLLPVEFAQ